MCIKSYFMLTHSDVDTSKKNKQGNNINYIWGMS